jgi:hypothetical protein
MNGMCDLSRSKDVSIHMNATLIWLIFINLFGYVLFITSIYKLRNIKKEFNIRVELSITFFAWFICT